MGGNTGATHQRITGVLDVIVVVSVMSLALGGAWAMLQRCSHLYGGQHSSTLSRDVDSLPSQDRTCRLPLADRGVVGERQQPLLAAKQRVPPPVAPVRQQLLWSTRGLP